MSTETINTYGETRDEYKRRKVRELRVRRGATYRGLLAQKAPARDIEFGGTWQFVRADNGLRVGTGPLGRYGLTLDEASAFLATYNPSDY